MRQAMYRPLQYDYCYSAAPTTTDLLFSEYIEGSSNNKALEISNATGNTINLSYSVKKNKPTVLGHGVQDLP
jgi:predicted extracellular nuclease